MEDKPTPRDDAYLKYLSGLVQPEPTDTIPKPTFGQRPPPSRRTKFKRPNVLVVCGGLLIIVLILIVRSILFPGPIADNSPEFIQRQQNANAWALSGAKGIILSRLKNADSAEFPIVHVDSQFLGGDRWRVKGMVTTQNEQQVTLQNRWEVEIEYSQDKKTGEVINVSLDGVLIYSR